MATGYTPNNTTVTIGFGVPADSSYFTPPGDGQEWIDETTGRRYIRIKGVWTDGVGLSASALLTAPATGAVAQSVDRSQATLADLGASVLTSGTIYAIQVPLAVGSLVTTLTVQSGETAGATLTHRWMGIMDSGLVVRAVSADNTGASLAADTVDTYTMATPLRITGVGPWYAFLNVTGTTPPSLDGIVDYDVDSIGAAVPILAGTSTTGKTTPPAVGSAAQTALTAVANKVWVGVA